MSIEEVHILASDEGAAQYISQKTGLDYERVLRIYRFGQPWPLGLSDAWDFSRQATGAGVDVFSAMAALAPLMDMTIEEKRAKLEALEQMIARGDQPSQELNSELEAELGSPVLDEHIEKVANLANEPTEVIHQVFGGFFAVLNRMSELTQELIDKQLRGKEEFERQESVAKIQRRQEKKKWSKLSGSNGSADHGAGGRPGARASPSLIQDPDQEGACQIEF